MKIRKKKITSLFVLTMMALAFTACSKDDGSSENLPNTSTHTLVLKAKNSESTGSHIPYEYDNDMTLLFEISENFWTSQEIALSENTIASMVINALGANLKLQIFVDGVLKKGRSENRHNFVRSYSPQPQIISSF
jgi:hypothetical protein